MEARLFNGDIEELRPIAEQWHSETKDNLFGIEISVDAHLADLLKLIGQSSCLLVLYDDKTPVGYMGVKIFTSPLGNQRIANEHYWYVLPDKRKLSSAKMAKMAMVWAKMNGCSHIIFNASKLASDLHDKVCHFYEVLGGKHFETSYIREL